MVKVLAASQCVGSVFQLLNDVFCVIVVSVDAQEDHVSVSVMDGDEVICSVSVPLLVAVDWAGERMSCISSSF